MNAELDLRAVPLLERLSMIIEAWKNLDRGGVLKLIVDREPKPLHFLLRTKYRGRFEWQYLREGPPDWSVAIKKL